MYEWKRIALAFTGKYITHLYAGNKNQLRLPDYHIMNLALSRKFERFDLKIKLNNLLDRNYKVLPNYRAPGFHLMGGLAYRLSP
jgi:outer membrane cobalamin receptor